LIVGELVCRRVGCRRVGLSASCPVTMHCPVGHPVASSCSSVPFVHVHQQLYIPCTCMDDSITCCTIHVHVRLGLGFICYYWTCTCCCFFTIFLSLCLHFNSHFSTWTWVRWYQNVSILDFIGAKGDGGGGDNWSYKTCKVWVRSSPPTKQHPRPVTEYFKYTDDRSVHICREIKCTSEHWLVCLIVMSKVLHKLGSKVE